MAQSVSGQLIRRTWKDGKTVTFGARLYAYGRRHRLVFGTNLEGWNDTRAEIELESIQQQVTRKTWMPHERGVPSQASEPAYDGGSLLFGPFARDVVEAKKSHGLCEKTIADLKWRLGYLLADLGRLELRQIDVARTDKLRDDLTRRASQIADAAVRATPLTETVKTRDGKRYQRCKRALSNTSINAILSLLSQILQRAVDYGYIDRNPLKAGHRRDRYLPVVKPKRTFLEVDELHSLLDAARELDSSARRDRRVGRRAALMTRSATRQPRLPCRSTSRPATAV